MRLPFYSCHRRFARPAGRRRRQPGPPRNVEFKSLRYFQSIPTQPLAAVFCAECDVDATESSRQNVARLISVGALLSVILPGHSSIPSTFLPREVRARGCDSVRNCRFGISAPRNASRLAGDSLQRLRYFQIAAAASDFRMSYLVRFVCELWPLYRDRRHIVVWQVIATNELEESNDDDGGDDDGCSCNVIISPFD